MTSAAGGDPAISAERQKAAANAFADPVFRQFWLAQVLALVAVQVYLAAAQWLVLDLTGSITLLGVVPLIQGLTTTFMTPIGGVVADRTPRRRQILVARLAGAAAALVASAFTLAGILEVWHIFAVVAALAVMASFSEPAAQAAVIDLVGAQRLMSGIAMMSAAQSVVMMAGPAIAGTLIATIGARSNVTVSAGLFLLAALVLATLPKIETVREAGGARNWLRDIPEGIRAVRASPSLSWLLIICSSNMFAAGLATLRPVYAREILEVGGSGFGLMGATFGIGAILASTVLVAHGRVKHIGWLFLGCLALWDSITIVYAFSRWFPLTLASELIAGLVGPMFQISTQTIVQTTAPPEHRGRITSLFIAVQQVYFIGQFMTGVAADHLGVTTVLAGGGIIRLALVCLFVVVAVPVRRAVTVPAAA